MYVQTILVIEIQSQGSPTIFDKMDVILCKRIGKSANCATNLASLSVVDSDGLWEQCRYSRKSWRRVLLAPLC